ncbi:adenine deaminase C-terminal domain-containing protein [Haloferax sp. YSSS75]|uniref:adenine deaminase C-terminal domain-containing protein n=1 Tax=Haloferax sp. YSSS75 TaxID=3388564 RepID=UPI00398CED32
MTDLHAVALGDHPADLVITNGRVFSPETGTYDSVDVVVAGDRVADLPTDGSHAISEATTVIDADGDVVLPGFVDAHTHLDTFQAFEQAYVHALTGGTTTVVSETDRFARRVGTDGVEGLLDATADLPIRVFATLTPIPFYGAVAGLGPDAVDPDSLLALASHPRVAGVGEVFWSRIVGRDDIPLSELVTAVREAGGVVWGHGAGCHDGKLSAFATVVDNDHELLDHGEAEARARRGITPIGRCGSIRDDIDFVASADQRVLWGEACLCSDGMWPAELLSDGYMDHVVRRTIDAGVAPETAFRMATLNPARHCNLDGLGSLSPGSYADVVVLSDVERVAVETVVSGGRVVVEDGEALVEYRSHDYPDDWYDSVTLDVDAERFRVPVRTDGRDGSDRLERRETVRAIGYIEGLLSEPQEVVPRVVDDTLVAAPERDVLLMALLPAREDQPDPGFTGFVTGLGLESGAVATSDTWGNPGVLVVGADAASMVRAVDHVEALGGGWVVVRDDEVVAALPTPIAGVCSDTAVETTHSRAEAVRSALADSGMTAPQPLLAIGTLTSIGMPWFKLGFDGYVDVVGDAVVGLWD